MAILSKKTPTHGTFDVEFSLTKGIIFTKIGLANGTILKLWAANPYPKFSREPIPRVLWTLETAPIELLAIQQKSLDRALLLYNFIREVRSSGVRGSFIIVHIRKFFKMHHNIVRFRFFPRIAKRSMGAFKRVCDEETR